MYIDLIHAEDAKDIGSVTLVSRCRVLYILLVLLTHDLSETSTHSTADSAISSVNSISLGHLNAVARHRIRRIFHLEFF
jgi:hypothetical protein